MNDDLFSSQVPGQQKGDINATAHMILGAIYVLFGMAILAMCFDLMQEEIVAKFRWIGSKIGIIDKEKQPTPSSADKGSTNNSTNPANSHRPGSTESAPVNSNSSITNQDKTMDDDNESGWPTHRSVVGGRKLSPRNNIARVHPMTASSNEGSLHQRPSSFKQH